VHGQHVAPLFAATLARWDTHPVLSKPVAIRAVIACDGSFSRTDLSIGEQLRQRAAMGDETGSAELAAFEKLLADAIAGALIADLEKEAAANGVDVRTWVARLATAPKPEAS
jgi:hypothetical protein